MELEKVEKHPENRRLSFCTYCRINKFREIGLPLLDESGNLIMLSGQPKNKLKIRKKFKCEVCGKKFNFSYNFNQHAKRLGHTPHNCNSCEQSFSTEVYLKKHILSDHTIKNHKCDSCEKAFSSKASLQYHYEVEHLGVRISCPKCAKEYTNQTALRRHYKFAHGEEFKVECEICGKSFCSDVALKRHIGYVHEGGNSVTCDLCQKNFSKPSMMRRHKNNGSCLKKSEFHSH